MKLIRVITAILVVFAVFVGPSTAYAQLVAERITIANFETHHVGGPDADAGIDDWFLSNGTLCAAISDPEHESPISPKGGVLIDIGHCDRNNDQWTVLQPLVNLSQSHVVPITEIDAGTTAGEAWIRTRALFEGVELITLYSVSLSEPNALRVSNQAQRVSTGDRFFSIGTVLMHPSGQTPPFSLLRKNLDASLGFQYPSSDRRSLFSLIGSMSATDLNILVGAEEMPPISYGIEQMGATITNREPATQREPEKLRTFSVTGVHFTAFTTLTQPAWLGTDADPPSLIDLARIPFLSLDEKNILHNEIRIWVGERSDVASITDLVFAKNPVVVGTIAEPNSRIHILTESGAPVTMVRPDRAGTFHFRLPPGKYQAAVKARAGRESTVDFEVHEEDRSLTLTVPELDEPAWVRLPNTFLGRLIFIETDSGQPIVFGDDLLGFQLGDEPVESAHEAPFLTLAGVPDDPIRVAIAPGKYRVVAVRGPEYEIQTLNFEAIAGQQHDLKIVALKRVAETPGWIAADFHVHTGESFDSGLPASRQIAAFAASGAEVLVATEHDRIVDPSGRLDLAGLAGELLTMTGVEVTSAFEGDESPYSAGHWNAFPAAYQPMAYRGGAPNLEGRRIRDAISDIRSLETKPFLQLNHPRPGVDEAEGDTFFAHLGVVGSPYDPTQPLTSKANASLIERSPSNGYRDLDYDGVELMNGPELTRYRRVRADWFSLLLQGEARVATANSDSHRLGVIVGLPRTYVETSMDTVESFEESALMEGLASGRAYGTTGPLVDLHFEESGLGALYTGSSGTLHIRVDAAPWVAISEWRAYVNGELVHRAPIRAGESAELPLAFDRDSFITVEVEGPAEGVYAIALPEFVPFAFTNPIFVDVDGNGTFDAPGLPEILPVTLTNPDRKD